LMVPYFSRGPRSPDFPTAPAGPQLFLSLRINTRLGTRAPFAEGAIVAPAPARRPDDDPVGGLIARAIEAGRVDERLQQHRRDLVRRPPVRRQPPREEKQIDFGYRAVHEMTLRAKEIVSKK